MRKTGIEAGAWLKRARSLLESSDQPSLEAQLVLAHVLGVRREALLAHPEWQILAEQEEIADALLSRLNDGEPLAYLTGWREFYGLSFQVSPEVLVPRPETEGLVDLALDWLRRHPNRRRAVDVGTGSGCIAAALTAQVDDLVCLAVERSWKALQVAAGNLRRLGVSPRTPVALGDLLNAFAGPFDVVCANLPYIPSVTLASLPVSRYEPRLALDGGADGLTLIRLLLADASRWLARSGLLLLEIEAGQAASAMQEARRWLPQAQVELFLDLNGLPRVVRVERV